MSTEAGLEALARAYDREDAAQRGEPSPWRDAADDKEWISERIACAEVGWRSYLAATQAAPVAVVVKPIEWVRRPIIGGEDRIMSYDGYYWLSRVPGGFMVIGEDGRGHVQRLGGDVRIVHPTEEAAKAAAQADFETRIRSALSPTLAVPGDMAEMPKPCGLASPSYNDCPNMKEVGGGMEGERYWCAICSKGYFLDYEDMK